jgi:cobalt-precorrin 5A hydrolase/precorrin-3B C17-methyltransferase
VSDRPAIILLGPGGLETARRIRAALPTAELHGPAAVLADGAMDLLYDDLGGHIRKLFKTGRPLLVLAAAAIPIRLLAPILGDKRAEPPLLAIAEDGSAVVPLLGGHHGANALALEVGAALETRPAITTAGDLRFGLALDQPPPGWTAANPDAAKPVMAALLAGEAVGLEVEAASADWLTESGAPFAREGARRVRVTDRAPAPGDDALVLHPKVLALGVGCERDAPAEELIALAERVLGDAGLARGAIACIASIELKAAEPAIQALAQHLNLPARFFSARALEAETPRLRTPSELVYRETGCHGVAEGAALAAAGASGKLLVAKTKGARTTAAIARAPNVIEPATTGRPRGRLAVIGIGPGQASWRTGEAGRLLAEAEDWVGYGGYLDLLPAPGLRTSLHAFPLGEEEIRVRAALDLAGSGRQVTLISSGDAGIYAMAALVFELIDREANPAWQRIETVVSPGISALQAAAARAGAPLGHDFCAISLSDLLTPWNVIEQRLRAAAEGDFVTALYNPASLRRRQGLARALAILESARPATTPVVIARNLGRESETVEIETLAELDQARIDMLTILIIGSSQTRRMPRLHGADAIYTPRGYLPARKAAFA